MRIEKIELEEFRIFNGNTINLGKHLTCISGYNGVGKSTLLAILSNIGELKKELGTHINGNQFRGEFSELIHGDPEFDGTGKKCTVYFSDLPPSTSDENYLTQLSFRSTFQAANRLKIETEKLDIINSEDKKETVTILKKVPVKYTRYRLIPMKVEERNKESKIAWPTYYLGLSRLFPIGESSTVSKKNNIPDSILEELMLTHKNILSSNQEYIGTSSLELADAKKKRGFAIKTNLYSEVMNSSGQDNLGQILLSVFSFEILKSNLGNKYYGGLLLIDEIDATLHPIAQNNLIDFLYKKSIELDLQIVFTTHSLSLLRHVIRKQELSNFKNFSTIYLTNKRGQLEPIHNPTINFIENDLMNTYTGANRSNDVPIFTEDDIGRWFFQRIINHMRTEENFQITFIDMHTGWTELIKLMKHDYNYFKNFIVALDPDINQSDNYLALKNSLNGTRFSLDRKNTNILILPGDAYVEKMMWDFVSSLDLDDEFYYEPSVEGAALTKDALISQGPYSSNYNQFSSDKLRIKNWFNNHRWLSDTIFNHWIKNPDNQQLAANFYNKFKEAYYPIYHQRR